MTKFFTSKKGPVVAFALVAFITAGTRSALAQSASTSGSTLAWHYDASGGRVPGWSPENPSIQQLAHAPSNNIGGSGIFARAPATNLRIVANRGAKVPPGVRLTYRFGAGSRS